jgi:hypothetical protein
VPKLHVGLVGFVSLGTAAWLQLERSNREDSKTGRVGTWYSRTSGSIDIREKLTNSTSSISFLIVNYVPKLHVGLVGFVSLGTAAWVQLDSCNQEDSKTGRVGIPGRPVL